MLKQIALVDAVKRVINGHRGYIMFEIDPQTTIEDLGFADGFLIEEEEPQPEPKPEPKEYKTKIEPKTKPKTEPKKSGPAGIDHGKLIALHKAGWSIEKIADEMGCTTTTVRNHIRQEEQNGAGDGAE
jgi:DNA-directed RNA polymerase specialized sigma24 family protein